MIPLGDVVPRHTRPRVTLASAFALVASVTTMHVGFAAEDQVDLLWRWGASAQTLPLPALATAPWIEPSWLAGIANAATLLFFGPSLEDRLGHGRFAVLLIGAAWCATLASVAVLPSPAVPVSGAAGPASALMAMYLALFPQSKFAFWVPGRFGGSLREAPIVWVVAGWAMLVPGHLSRFAQTGRAGVPPLIAVAAGIVVGLACAPWLPKRERMTVAWWDVVD
jgi:membrane associated rhomboid family serine protease